MTVTITTRKFDVIAKHLANREPFKTHGALRAMSGKWITAQLGRLPADWRNTVRARSHVIDYVIYSYQTPIGWRDTEAGWVIPAEHYSQTTSVHQGRIRAALAYLGETYAE
jgi:hypothetical protein